MCNISLTRITLSCTTSVLSFKSQLLNEISSLGTKMNTLTKASIYIWNVTFVKNSNLLLKTDIFYSRVYVE